MHVAILAQNYKYLNVWSNREITACYAPAECTIRGCRYINWGLTVGACTDGELLEKVLDWMDDELLTKHWESYAEQMIECLQKHWA